jgi:DNA-binding IclR family transcriptional regulator
MTDDRSSRLLQRGLDILEYLAIQREPVGIRDLAQVLSLSPSTCHRLLVTLEERGYVRQEEQSRRWMLWLKPLELGGRLLNGPGLPARARPYLEELMNGTNETVFLGVRDGDWVVYIDTIMSQQAIRTAVTLGSRWPLHCTALGKVLIAALPDAEIEQILTRDLPALTETTITDPMVLRQQIDAAREQGYALNFGETVEGNFCSAAPLRDYTGGVIAAIGAAGPIGRIKEAGIPDFTAQVCATAARISAHLGYILAG